MHRSNFIKAIFILLVIYPVFNSCDSALSDVEFNDPYLIKPWIYLIREETVENGLNYRMEAYIFDKNFDLIEIKNGGVTVNNSDMILRTSGVSFIENLGTGYSFEQGKFYITPNSYPNIELNTQYDFDIELSNGEIFNSYVVTHEENFTNVTVPEIHNSEHEMEINWEVINDYPVKIYMEYQYVEDGKTHINSHSIEPSDSLIELGKCFIDSTFFDNTIEPYEALIKVKNYKFGVMNTAFRDTCKINSVHIVERICLIE